MSLKGARRVSDQQLNITGVTYRGRKYPRILSRSAGEESALRPGSRGLILARLSLSLSLSAGEESAPRPGSLEAANERTCYLALYAPRRPPRLPPSESAAGRPEAGTGRAGGSAGPVVRVRRDAEEGLVGRGRGAAVRGYEAAFGGVDGYGLADGYSRGAAGGGGGGAGEEEEEDEALTYGEVCGGRGGGVL